MKFFLLVILSNFSLWAIDLESRYYENPFEIDLNNILLDTQEAQLKSLDPFPRKNMTSTISPIDGRRYQAVLVSKPHTASIFSSFDLYRYVTVYNVEEVRERIPDIPWFEEDCHDSSFRMAAWSRSKKFEVQLSSQLGISAYGFSAGVSAALTEGIQVEINRSIMATANIVARHYPVKVSETWYGHTYIQTFHRAKGTFGYLKELAWWETARYPYEFELTNQNIGIVVERKVLRVCEGENAPDFGEQDFYH